jgi:hypothetical protein
MHLLSNGLKRTDNIINKYIGIIYVVCVPFLRIHGSRVMQYPQHPDRPSLGNSPISSEEVNFLNFGSLFKPSLFFRTVVSFTSYTNTMLHHGYSKTGQFLWDDGPVYFV